MKRKLYIGIGNISRADDALGWLFLERLEKCASDGEIFENRYQLQVEDAEMISTFEEVVFIDATEEVFPDGFSITECQPAASYFYSSHLQSPEAILYLADSLFGAAPRATLVSITGKKWGLGEAMGRQARENLEKAWDAFLNLNNKKVTITEKIPSI